MATAFVNSWFSGGAASGTSASIGPQSLTAGNLLVLLVACKGTGLTVSSITDTAGNTYISCGVASVDASNYRTELFYVKNARGNASNTTTVTMSGTVTDLNVASLQYSGLALNSPFDQVVTGHGASGSAWSTASTTPSGAGELCVSFAIAATGYTGTAGTGFLRRDGGTGSGAELEGEDILSTSVAQNGAWLSSIGSSWQVVQAFFSTVDLGLPGARGIQQSLPPRRSLRPNPASRFRSPLANAYLPATPLGTFSQPALVQHLSHGAIPNSGITNVTGNNFNFWLPNAVLAGNCLIVGISVAWSAGRTCVLTDNNGNTWPAAAAQQTDGANSIVYIFVLPNANAGPTKITVTFDGLVNIFQFTCSEFCNVASASPINGTSGQSNPSTNNLSAGTLTTGDNDQGGGSLIWMYGCTQGTSGPTHSATLFAPSSGFTLLDANISSEVDGMFHASAYSLQFVHGPITPGLTVSATNVGSYNLVAVALKAATAGTPKPTGVPHILRVCHFTNQAPPATWKLQFPSGGNTIAAMWCAPLSNITFTSETDNKGNTYSYLSPNGGPQMLYAANATTGPDLLVTLNLSIHLNNSNTWYDMEGMVTDPARLIDATAGVGGTALAATDPRNIEDTAILSPPSFGITLVSCFFGIGPCSDKTAASPAAAFYDSVYYPTANAPANEETDSDPINNADAYAHITNLDQTTQHWGWILVNQNQNSAWGAMAVHFQAQSAPPGSATFWVSRGPRRGFHPNPTNRFRTPAAQVTIAATTENTQLLAGLATLEQTTTQRVAGLATLTAENTQRLAGLSTLEQGATQLLAGLATLTLESTQRLAGLSSLEQTSTQRLAGTATLTQEVTQRVAGLATLEQGATQRVAGLATLTLESTQRLAGIAALEQVTTQRVAGLATLTNEATQRLAGLSTLESVATQRVAGLATLTLESTQRVAGLATLEAATTQRVAGLATLTNESTQRLAGLATLEQTSTQRVAGLATLESIATQRVAGLATLAQGSQQLVAGLATLEQTSTQRVAGLATLESAATQRVAGSATLVQGSQQLVAGLATLEQTSTQRAAGLATLETTTTQRVAGSATLVQGSQQLVAGLATLTNEATQRAAGLSTLEQTSTQRLSGTATLTFGNTQRLAGIATPEQTTTQRVAGLAILESTTTQLVAGLATLEQTGTQRLAGLATLEPTSTQRIAGLATLEQTATQRVAGLTTLEQASTQRVACLATLEAPSNTLRLAGLATLEQTVTQRVSCTATLTLESTQRVAGTATIDKTSTQSVACTATLEQTSTQRVAGLATLDTSSTGRVACLTTLTVEAQTNQLLAGLATLTIEVTPRVACSATLDVLPFATTVVDGQEQFPGTAIVGARPEVKGGSYTPSLPSPVHETISTADVADGVPPAIIKVK